MLACNGFEILDLGVMVPTEKILDTAEREGVDVIGLSGLITPSLDEMVYVAKELERRNLRTPLLIGGATTSRVHTAVKIAPQYSGLVAHVLDASRSVGVAARAVSDKERPKLEAETQTLYDEVRKNFAGRQVAKQLISLSEARKNAPVLAFGAVTKPSFLGTQVLNDYPLDELVAKIDWTPFFLTWELSGRYPNILQDEVVGEVATKLFEDAQELLRRIVTEKRFTARAVFGLFPAARVGDDLELYTDDTRKTVRTRLHTLRQQTAKRAGQPNFALADFVAPRDSGVQDYVGGFAVSVHGADAFAREFEKTHDDYNAILVKALADRLAEAFAERLHERVRKEFWGYAPDEEFSNDELIRERYQGIRPAPGYPASPDHTEKRILFDLLDAEKTAGITLTESYAMYPGAAVSGFYFAHPEARYFGVGKLSKDQLEDYAARKGMTLEEAERWLAPNLSYDPDVAEVLAPLPRDDSVAGNRNTAISAESPRKAPVKTKTIRYSKAVKPTCCIKTTTPAPISGAAVRDAETIALSSP